ncbi:MAG: hypothetical protein ACK55I_46800, partial [bacterium]
PARCHGPAHPDRPRLDSDKDASRRKQPVGPQADGRKQPQSNESEYPTHGAPPRTSRASLTHADRYRKRACRRKALVGGRRQRARRPEQVIRPAVVAPAGDDAFQLGQVTTLPLPDLRERMAGTGRQLMLLEPPHANAHG